MYEIEMTCYLHVYKHRHQGTYLEAKAFAMKRFLEMKQYFSMSITTNDGTCLRLCVDRT